MFFVLGTSWVDIDNDKVPNCSRKWKEYGMRTIPTKDKKLNPVSHVMATVGTGFICWFAPDKLGMRLGDMMRNAIIAVCPSGKPALRASLALFIDRGYLEFVKH